MDLTLFAELRPGVWVAEAFVPSEHAQIAAVLVRSDGVAGNTRFDLGKYIFLDRIDGIDLGKVPRNIRVELARRIAVAIDQINSAVYTAK